MSYDKELYDIREIIKETGCSVPFAKMAYEAVRNNAREAINLIENKKYEVENVR